jgi:outer membrane protein insertion porin family
VANVAPRPAANTAGLPPLHPRANPSALAAASTLPLLLALAAPAHAHNTPTAGPPLSGGASTAQEPTQKTPPSTAPLRPQAPESVTAPQAAGADTAGMRSLRGLHVESVQFRGVDRAALEPIPHQMELQPGQPLDPAKVSSSLRLLYASGVYQTVRVDGIRTHAGVIVVFTGRPKLFLGRTSVFGVKNEQLRIQLLASTQLPAGRAYSAARLKNSEATLNETLRENGYYLGKIRRTEQVDDAHALVNVYYQIDPGPQATIGAVEVDGAPGMSIAAFRKTAKLEEGDKVTHKTVNRALTRLRKRYDQRGYWASAISLESSTYTQANNHLNYRFTVRQGPIVHVKVDGAKIGKAQIRRLVPIYEEGTVDLDLLNEGAHNLRDYMQDKGYFDATVTHQPVHETANEVTVLYMVKQGLVHHLDSVTVTGNKYFGTNTIMDHVSIHPANLVERHGVFSQSMVDSDVSNITALYQGNGFSHVKVTAKVSDPKVTGAQKIAHFTVTYVIDEGQQQKIGAYDIAGASPAQLSGFQPLLNTQSGQPYSSLNVTGDRDEILSYYYSLGYSNAQVTVQQATDPKNPALVNVKMLVNPGNQFFIHNILASGLHYTRPSVVERRVTFKPGQPLDQAALLDTQRRLYNLALFNEVNSAVQNPNGAQPRKNVLLQMSEARRWDVTYGFGLQAQTGTPFHNPPSAVQLIQLGLNPSTYSTPNGHFGISPDVILDVSRINLRGTAQSATFTGEYGALEQEALLTYQDPALLKHPQFDLSITGGYVSSENVTTFQASSLGGNIRMTGHLTKATTIIPSLEYRDVRVNSNSIQVSPALIPILSQPTRVGGPAFTYIRDTRDNPLDAHRGTYNTAITFFADSTFGSQANFGRADLTNATYYTFGRRQWVFARETRYGQERAFGTGGQKLIPLPERLYAGGPESDRGFALNSAGPRDPQTGYPLGGNAVFVNSLELRTPYPTLPYVGNNLGFVLFLDSGNVFDKSSDVWPSLAHFYQPRQANCTTLPTVNTLPNGKYNIYEPTCSFNYLTEAPGLGLRYHTPVGPIRIDMSYNLDPPYYPVVFNYESNTSTTPIPQVGQAGHFNFFFSIGQTF